MCIRDSCYTESVPCTSIKSFLVNKAFRQFAQAERNSSDIKAWCDWLICPDSTSPQQQLLSLKAHGTKRVCGHVFSHGEIAYNCLTCQSDSTCVICYDCFKNSVHEGHEYFFHKTGAGGCCDCGDAEAWNPSGFCCLHTGVAAQTDTLPGETHSRAVETIEAVISHISRCIHVAQASVAAIGLEPTAQIHMVVLHKDDVHSFSEIMNVVLPVNPELDTDQLAHQLETQGEAVLLRGPLAECTELHLQITQAPVPLMARVQSETMDRDEMVCVQLLDWLSQLVAYSDGFASLIADSLNLEEGHAPLLSQSNSQVDHPTRLDAWIGCDWLLRQKFGTALHQLYMQLIPDPQFKALFARTLLQQYGDLSLKHVEGKGTSESSIFNLTVQLFTVPSLVPQLVQEQDMLQIVLASIGAAFTSALDSTKRVVDPNHPVIQHSRYVHLFNDLRYALSIPGVASHVTCGDSRLLSSWLQILAAVQLMDPIQHQRGTHVEYESESWLHAFDLSIKLSPIQAAIVDGFTEICNNLPHEQKCQNAHSVVSMCCNAINAWANSRNLSSVELLSPMGTAKVFAVYVLKGSLSFHIPLHRFLATMLLRCVTQLGIDPAEFLRLKYLPPSFVASLVEWPLQAMVLAAQTKIGMWKRNGNTLLNQVINYQHSPVASYMSDLDLPLIQLGASTLPACMFLSTLLHRFGLFEWWWSKEAGSKLQLQLACESVSTLIVIVSELFWYSAGLQSLERELVHKLVVGPCTHSKLRDCVAHKKKAPTTEQFDQLLDELTTFRTATKVAQGHYELKDEHLHKYDPYFFRLTREQHQVAAENMSRRNVPHKTGPRQPLPKAMLGIGDMLVSVEMLELLWCPLRDCEDSERCSADLLHGCLHLLQISAEILHDGRLSSERKGEFVRALEMSREGGDSVASKLCSLSISANNKQAQALVHELSSVSALCLSCADTLAQQSSSVANTESQPKVVSEKDTKKLAARKRAMAAMKKKRERFSKTQEADSPAASQAEAQLSVNNTHEEGASSELTCILCCEADHESTLGHLGFAQQGASLRRNQDAATLVQFCSHAMHLSCQAEYLQTMRQKQSGMQSFEGQHVLNVEAGEFLCPLCKSVCNLLVPCKEHLAQGAPAEQSEPQLVSDITSWFRQEGGAQKDNVISQDEGDQEALRLATRLLEVTPQSMQCTSPGVNLLSHSWLSISYMLASIQMDQRPDDATLLALRSLVHNVRALAGLWWDEEPLHQQYFQDPLNCLLQGGTTESIPNVTQAFSCLLYTSDAADEEDSVDLGGRRII
eukprot:TRINITY_DN14311_c0_g2_i3.p1 TRINITY_DN14311_c0_g2~~TRINITY_DN14311_c0_g2_i3.p1  ORF type:complete len:1287 (-),score=227.62 TRINITY_DN14311_c0_g2_i3:55-3915(-)